MPLFELVLGLMIGGALLTVWSQRIGIPYPALLALAGAIAAYLPGVRPIAFDPGLALALFVAPVLLDAAYDASPRDIRESALTIGLLAVAVVAFTVAAVAIVAHAIVPGLSWGAAVTLGAVVAPPDAAAATAVLRTLRPPHRIMVILEGESLLNDAAALIIYRVAVTAATGALSGGWTLVPSFVLVLVGGVAFGWVMARLWLLVPMHQIDMPIHVLVQFLLTFAVWIIAERLGVSPILAVVVYGMVIARFMPATTDARRRIASYAVWEVAVFVLNMLAFILIGLQLRGIVEKPEQGTFLAWAGVAAAVLVTVVVVRVVCVLAWNAVMRRRASAADAAGQGWRVRPTVGGGVLIAWCGMRGIVTLATALGLPNDFPQRDLIVFCAFWVTLGTLALLGPSLRPLMRILRLPEDSTVEDEVLLARQETARAALGALDEAGADPSGSADILRAEYQARAAETKGEQKPQADDTLSALQQRAVAAQRETLLALRREGRIGEDAFHEIEEELDIIEMTATPTIRAVGAAGGLPDDTGPASFERAPGA